MRRFNSAIVKVKNSAGEYEPLPALRGYSSYQLAVANGFEGTEEEWMNSIIGDGWVGAFQELERKHDNLAAEVVEITPMVLTGTLLASGWTWANDAFEYTLAVADIPEDPTSIMVDIDLSGITDAATMSAINEAWGKILKCSVISAGNLYFVFTEAPAINIPIKAEVIV